MNALRPAALLLLLVPALASAQGVEGDDDIPDFVRERVGDLPPAKKPAPPAEPQGPPVLLPDPEAPPPSTPLPDAGAPPPPPADTPLLPPSLYDPKTGLPRQQPTSLDAPPAPGAGPGEQEDLQAQQGDEPEEPEDTAFELARLFSGPFIKASSDVEDVIFGIHFQIAPVRAVAKQVLDDFKTQHPEIAPLMELAQDVDPDALASATDEQRKALFLAVPGLSAEERAAIEGFDFAGQRDALDGLVGIITDPEEAITFSLEPWVGINLDLVSISAVIPLAGFTLHGETTFEVGNVTVDARFGHHWGDDIAGGLGYGVELALPSGTERADALALTNQLDAHRFLHSYLGVTPYVIGGLDLQFVLIQTSHRLTILSGVRDEPEPGTSVYYAYGASLIGTPGDIITVSAEFDGLVPVFDAEAFGAHTFTGGVRFHFAGIRPGVAVQVPLATPSRGSLGRNSALSYGAVADVNVLVQVDFGF